MAASVSDFTIPLADACARSGYSERHLRRLVDTGRVPAAKLRGRLLFTAADVEALATPQPVEHEADRIIAELIANAPRFSEAQRSRIAAVLASADSEAVAS